MKSAAERRDFPARLIWGANPVSREGERPRPVAFTRTRQTGSDGGALRWRLAMCAQRDYCALRPPPDLEKWK